MAQQSMIEDSLAYIDNVKQVYADQPQVYQRFIDILSQFRHKTLSITQVLENISQLFYGNPNLINGFNAFIPHVNGYAIEASADGLHIMITTPNGPIHHGP
ncbi:hypothetical protein M422DRAFT_42488 [Sphaerobolus stellatus SS14]|nr:hypothetical protein M422DRAFT_42488 [Sphaerobolus stellatus SS14]